MGAAEKRGQKGCCLNRSESERKELDRENDSFPQGHVVLQSLMPISVATPRSHSHLAIISIIMFSMCTALCAQLVPAE